MPAELCPLPSSCTCGLYLRPQTTHHVNQWKESVYTLNTVITQLNNRFPWLLQFNADAAHPVPHSSILNHTIRIFYLLLHMYLSPLAHKFPTFTFPGHHTHSFIPCLFFPNSVTIFVLLVASPLVPQRLSLCPSPYPFNCFSFSPPLNRYLNSSPSPLFSLTSPCQHLPSSIFHSSLLLNSPFQMTLATTTRIVHTTQAAFLRSLSATSYRQSINHHCVQTLSYHSRPSPD